MAHNIIFFGGICFQNAQDLDVDDFCNYVRYVFDIAFLRRKNAVSRLMFDVHFYVRGEFQNAKSFSRIFH